MNLKNLPCVASRKFAIKLIAAVPWLTKKKRVTCGNHSVRDLPKGHTFVRSDDGMRDVKVVGNREFCFYNSVIAVANDYQMTLHVTSAGHCEKSISATIRQYAAHFKNHGYEIEVVV